MKIAKLLLFLALIATAGWADAATVTVGDLMLAPNGSGYLDVRVTGNGEVVNLAGYELRITPAVGTTSQLFFVEENESFLSAADYLFALSSAAAVDGLPSSVGLVSTTTLPGDTFTGGDGSDDFSDVTIANSLLVRLSVQHDAGPADPATTLGHQYSVSLTPASGDSMDFSGGGSNTGFVDSSFAPVAFDSTVGTVSIVVPEPSCLGLAVLCVAALNKALRYRRALCPR